MSEAKQRTLNLTMSVGSQSLPLDGRVLTPEMTAEALNTFRGPQGPKGDDGFIKFEELTDEQRELLRGPRGFDGPAGPAGPEGPQGQVGPKGPAGEPGKDAPQDAYTPSNPPPYPVKSVNNKTGEVSLSASDVGALPATGTAADSNKLGGVEASKYAKLTDIPKGDDIDLLSAYPVGSIYLSANSESPASLFGGTWEQLKDRFLLGAGDSYAVGNTGGEAAHTLTVNEMPKHTHQLLMWLFSGGSATKTHYGMNYGTNGGIGYGTNNSESEMYYYNGETGGSAAHNNMPPYLAVYMWKRVS